MPNIVPLDMPAFYWREKAQRAHRSGQYSEAVRLYRAALRKHDDNAIRRELAGVYADMRCISVSDRLYLENLARDAGDTDSLYGLARNRSLSGDENSMADMLDLYLRLAPCGDKADRARDILWQMPRPEKPKKRMRRAEVLCAQAHDRAGDAKEALKMAEKSWKRGKTAACAHLLGDAHMRLNHPERAVEFASLACEMEPANFNSRLLLAAALKQKGLHHACHAALREAMKLCTATELAPMFCRAALSLGENALAAELLEREIEKHPDSIDLMLLLAISLRADGRDLDHADQLLRRAAALDEEDPVSRALLDIPADDDDSAMSAPMQQAMQFLHRVSNHGLDGEEDPHAQLLHLMRLPIPGMADLAIQMMIKTGDALGLRMALLENDLPPMVYAVMLSALKDMGSPLPCFARVEGRLCLLPQKPRPPYDEDLHVLFRRLLRDVGERVPLDLMVSLVPEMWKMLPESARRHVSQSRDDVWLSAFSAYLIFRSGDTEGAKERLVRSKTPLRAGRAFMQLMRRSKRPYEVH